MREHMLWKMELTAFIFLVVTAGSCLPERAPLVSHQAQKRVVPGQDTPTAFWALDSLRPEENAVLIDRRAAPISINMQASGNGHYLVQLSANGRPFRPFKLSMVQGEGQTQFSGKITWFVKPKGKSEKLVIGLYWVEETSSGKTEVITLLKQFTRKYDVGCNERECSIILFFKKHIFCSCKPEL